MKLNLDLSGIVFLLLIAQESCIIGGKHIPFSVYDDAVVYISKGRSLPAYMYLTIELASRTNHVVVISEVSKSLANKCVWNNVSFINMNDHFQDADKFSQLYVHMALDKSEERKKYELVCLQRWFILHNFMTHYNVKRVFYGDHDAAVYMRMASVFEARGTCDAVISIEAQRDHRRRRASGHASLWKYHALTSFTAFITGMYTRHLEILQQTEKTTGVSDMTLLWYWWVAHTSKPGWGAGRPFDGLSMWLERGNISDLRQASDTAFVFSKKLLQREARDMLTTCGATGHDLVICNGLDVVQRTVFDHMQGWSETRGFMLGLTEEKGRPGVPSVVGTSLKRGGAPEDIVMQSLSMNTSSEMIVPLASAYADARLYFACLHYQGDTKDLMVYDICRLLLLTGARNIVNIHNRVLCGGSMKRHPGYPCRNHSVIGQAGSVVCA